MSKYRVLDLFSGAGGLSCGLDMVDGVETVAALDFDEDAIKTLKYNKNSISCVVGDITDREIKDDIIRIAKERDVNMIVGGPPCQGFSSKGKSLGLNDPRNFLFLEYVDIVESVDPDVFIIENVKNIISTADGYFINEIVDIFQKMGYLVNYNVVKAYDLGVPQKRERAIIVGSKDFRFNFDFVDGVVGKTNVRDAISDLAYLESGEGKDESTYLNSSKSDYQRLLRNDKGILYNHVATKHSDVALKKLKMIPPEKGKEFLPPELHGRQKFKTTWSRLEWDSPSPTIDTRFDTPSNGKNSHPFLNRSITPREAARIQSFPDSYRFLGKKTSICKQIGNAVPPIMAKAIGDALMRQSKRVKKEMSDIDGSVIYNSDAFDQVVKLRQQNILVDHIITDPPYLISVDNNLHTMGGNRNGVDFGIWDKKFDVLGWIKPYSDILNKDGSMIIFCSYRFISHIIDILEISGMVVKDFIEWKKTNPMPRNINRRYVQDTEFAIWAVKKGSRWVFNKPDNVPYLRSSFSTPVVSGKERTSHPTQKSLKLMMRIIDIHTNPGDVILDPFMGSGTTGVASILRGRKFIGIEKEKKFYHIAKDRITNISMNGEH